MRMSSRLLSAWIGSKDVFGIGSSERTQKICDLPHGWIALLSGSLSAAEALVNEFEAELQRHPGSFENDKDLLALMMRPPAIRRRALADEFVSRTMAMSYAELLSTDINIPAGFVDRKLAEMETKIKLDAELIIAGFASLKGEPKRRPYVFQVSESTSQSDTVTCEADYAAIGSGANIALCTVRHPAAAAQPGMFSHGNDLRPMGSPSAGKGGGNRRTGVYH
jgi:hypothetical protein